MQAIKRLHQFITAPADKSSRGRVIFWFSFNMTLATVYGFLVLQRAFSGEYIIQDDARQHVFWMQRFVDSGLFPGDLMADYFQTVAPWGYTGFYWVMAKLGIAPVLLSKLLPPVLGLITTAYCFGITMQLLPVPVAACISGLLMNHYMWMRDDVVSATAVAFIYPLFGAFLYYLLRQNLAATCATIVLLGLFYPQGVFIAVVMLLLQLVKRSGWRLQLSVAAPELRFIVTCLTAAFLVMLLYALKSNVYGPVFTAAEARNLQEFLPRGEFNFFSKYPQDFWFTGQRSGMVPRFGTILPTVASCFLVLPLLFPAAFPLFKVLQKWRILLDVTLASLVMFFVAHGFLFRLHLPSRYTEHSMRFVTAVAAGIAFATVIDALFCWAEKAGKNQGNFSEKWLNGVKIGQVEQPARGFVAPEFLPQWQRVLGVGLGMFLLVGVMLEPTWLPRFPRTDYIVGGAPEVYEFFAAQPKDIVIASVAMEMNNIPVFSERSLFVGSEGYPVPYHQGYYRQMRQRTQELLTAHYTPDGAKLRSFIEQHGIDFWLVEAGAFEGGYLQRDRWIMQYDDIANEAIANLNQGITPALAAAAPYCTVLQTSRFTILQAECIAKRF